MSRCVMGTRYLLKLFHAAGDSWLAHRETRLSAAATAPNSDDYYEMMHRSGRGCSAFGRGRRTR
jgi:hypothetical protein